MSLFRLENEDSADLTSVSFSSPMLFRYVHDARVLDTCCTKLLNRPLEPIKVRQCLVYLLRWSLLKMVVIDKRLPSVIQIR